MSNRPINNSSTIPKVADVALLTIIPEAYDAVRQVFGLRSFEPRNGYEWAWGSMQMNAHQVTVVSGLALDRENIAAATFTDALLDAWHPRHLLLVDIGGAVKGRDDVQLGDVVTHTNLHYYDFKKESDSSEDSPRHLPHAAPSTRLRELSRRPSMRSDSKWIRMIRVDRPEKGLPKVLPGEMLVGGTLFANSPRLHLLLKKHPKVIAVEMEGVGVARGVLDWGVRGEVPEFLIVRGMSDFCNVQPDENQRMRDCWKLYAANAAAAHAYALVNEMAPRTAPLDAPFRRFTKRDEPLDNLWQIALTEIIGRDDELNVLKRYFAGAPPKNMLARRHAIVGEAGMGKSVLARQVVEKAGEQYKIRWWIDAEDELRIRAGLRALANKLEIPSACTEVGLEGGYEVEKHRYLSDLRDYFDSNLLSGRVLIVLDNVDDSVLKHGLQTSVLRYLPVEKCDVLITSQSTRWQPIAKTTRIEGLKPSIGAKLIASESCRPELALDADVNAICSMFGGRPLFLKQVAVLFHDGDDPARFYKQLVKTPEDALEVLPESEGFQPLWRATYAMAIERAERSRPGARQLLEIMSCFGAEPIPYRLITAIQQQGTELSSIEAVLNTLTDRSLIEKQGGLSNSSYSIHRIVAALMRTLSKEREALLQALELAAIAMISVMPRRDLLRRPEELRFMASISSHVWALIDYTRYFRFLSIPAVTLNAVAECASLLGLYLRSMSEWNASEQANEIAVELTDQDSDPGGIALRTIRLANIMRQRGKFQPAEKLVQSALPQLKLHGEPCDYAWGITVEARILRHRPKSAPEEALVRLSAAVPILESSEQIHEPAVFRQLSELYGYLSVLHRQLANLCDAEEESLKGLRLIADKLSIEEILNSEQLPNDHLLATHLRGLGGIWRLRGDFRRAKLAHLRVLNIFVGVYGQNHTDVYRALDSLGRVQREWGDLEEALNTFKQAGQISDTQFGIGHAHSGTAAVNRALTYLELNQARNAYEEAARGLNIYKSVYNEPKNNSALKNEATVWALFVQANALAAIGKLDSAVRDHKNVLEWRLGHQKPNHAHQASSYFALAEVIWQRDGNAALPMVLEYHRKAFEIREHVFGSIPNFWVAQSQARLGQLMHNKDLLQCAHEYFSIQLKPGHWRTREVAAFIEDLDQTRSN